MVINIDPEERNAHGIGFQHKVYNFKPSLKYWGLFLSLLCPSFLFLFLNFILIMIASIVWNRRFEAMFVLEGQV